MIYTNTLQNFLQAKPHCKQNYLKDEYEKKHIQGAVRSGKPNKDYKRGINMRGAMPNPQAVILLMGTVAQNTDIYKYPIYNFLESRLFY